MQPTYVEAPWGGYKQSGIGRELGTWGVEEYMNVKQVFINLSEDPVNWFSSGKGGQHMTYYGGKELANAFRTVRKNTIQIAQDIPEDKYDFKPSPDSRSVKQTLAHIATLTTFPMMLHGERIPIEKIDFMEYMKKVAAEEAQARRRRRRSSRS